MLTFRRIMLGFAIVMLLAAPLLVLAQEDEETPLVEFTSEDGIVTISHPEGWVVVVDEFDPTSLYLANSQDLADRLTGESADAGEVDDSLQPGDQALIFLSFPRTLLTLFGIEIADDASIEEVASAIATAFFPAEENIPEPDATAEADEPADSTPTVGEITVTEIGDGLELGIADYVIASENVEGRFFVLEENGVVTLGILAAHTGEYTEELEALAFEIIDSLQFNVSAEELEAMIMGEPLPEDGSGEAPAATEEPGS